MATPTYTKAGTKAATATKLDAAVFGVELRNHALLHDAYVAYLANGRENLALTKTRGDVSGGGKKPWRQKGTGRARIGSIRAPQWRHGGTVFGSTGEENYARRLNVTAKRSAIRQALSLANTDRKISVIEDIALKSAKTAELAKLLAKIEATRRVLLVVEQKSDELMRASRNLQDLKIVRAAYVTAYDVLNADHIVFTAGALEQTTKWLTPAKGGKL